MYGEQIIFTGDIAIAWEVYQKLLSFSNVTGFGSIEIDFNLLNIIPFEVDDSILFWEALEIIHLKTINFLSSRRQKKRR